MKKLKLTFFVFLMFVFVPGVIFAQGMAVFDFSNWLSAIDQVYAMYDQIQNTVNMVENQYKQIQKTIEAARGIEWDNPSTYFSYTGLENLRSDLQASGARLNRLITSAQNLQSSLKEPSMQFGGVRYSVADLFGLGDENRNLLTALEDTTNSLGSSMKGVIKTLTDGLTDEQKVAIWRKYGVSPENYMYARTISQQVASAAEKALSRTTEQAKTLLYESQETAAELVKAARETRDPDGNSTEGAFRDANLALLDLVNSSINNLSEAVADFAGMYASKVMAEQKAEDEDEEQFRQTVDNYRTINSRVSDSFRKVN
ncbi:MAG: hypothetical protein J5647_03870 [Spirochaetaceae bacterium]|nr:hypothetical protein [Spirochaetaceae bacterium]